MKYQGVIERYRKYLPVTKKTPVITLLEGNTPLIPSVYLSQILGEGFKVYFKFEGLNPTGSFKDRGMTLAVSKAVEEGSKAVMCASTGNTSASAAAYAARAKIKCIVLIPKGPAPNVDFPRRISSVSRRVSKKNATLGKEVLKKKASFGIALGKLAQALIHGATVIAVDGNFDDALKLVREITAKHPVTLVNSINPYRIEGQKTASFEICDVLGDAPDFQCMPVGNAGNITAYWKGYKEYKKAGKIKSLPKLCGFQAEGAAPIVLGRIIKEPQTIATAIKIGNPASWKQAEQARDESGGLIDMISDSDIIKAYELLAKKEGIFVEPASAASVAGLLKLYSKGYFNREQRTENREQKKIVCILTGHGLKDPDRAIKTVKEPDVVPPKIDAVLEKAGL